MTPHSEQTQEITKALVGLQSELEPAKKDSENPHFKSTYADLAACIKAAKPLLAKYGLAVIQTTHIESTSTILTTRLAHESGQYFLSQVALNPVKNDPQGTGAALTYHRRFQFSAIIGLSSEDDDGNTASDVGGKPQQQTQQREKPPTQSATFKMTDKFDMNNNAHKKYFQKIAQEKRFVGDLKQIATDMHGRITMDKIAGAFPDPDPEPTDNDAGGVEM